MSRLQSISAYSSSDSYVGGTGGIGGHQSNDIEGKAEGSCSLSKEWLGPPVQTFRKLGIAVITVIEFYFAAHQGAAGRLVFLEQALGVEDGLTQLGIDGKRWSLSAVCAAHHIDRPLALLACPVRAVDIVGDSPIEFFDPICRFAAPCFY
jgi:hypothetical protein